MFFSKSDWKKIYNSAFIIIHCFVFTQNQVNAAASNERYKSGRENKTRVSVKDKNLEQAAVRLEN